MATRRQQNWLGQQRVDVSDLRAVESAVAADFDILAGRIMAGRQPLIVRGFTISTTNAAGNSAEELQLSVASGLLLHFGASEAGTIFMVEDDAEAETLSATNPRVRGGFIANSVNYVGLDLLRSEDPDTSDLKQFLDADTKLEIPKTVPVARTLNYSIVISTQPFSISTNICPIAKVETNTNNNVTAVTDSRNLMFRLGSGGDSPDALDSFTWSDSARRENNQYFAPPTSSADPFVGGDKGIVSFKEWMDAIMTRLWEVGSGEHWYRPNNRDAVKLICAQPVFSSTQDNWEWTSGTNTLAWQSLSLAFENSTVYFNTITNGSAVLNANGQCLYVDLQRASSAAPLVPVVSTLVAMGTPTIPGSRFILAWRYGGQIYVRDRGFEVGRSFVVATPSVLGIVKLSRAATTPLAPIVLADSERNAANGVAGLDASQVVLGTGLSRDTTFISGTLTIGAGTNDSAVSIAKSSTPTTINGAVLIKDTVDTAAANTMSVGATTQTSLTMGRTGAPTTITGSATTIDSAGALSIGDTLTTGITIGRGGATTGIDGVTTTVEGFSGVTINSDDGSVTIGNATAGSVNISQSGHNTSVVGTLSVGQAVTAGSTIELTGSNPSSSTGFTDTLTPMNIPKAWAKVTTTGGTSTSATINAGFNVASASVLGTQISVTIQNDLAAAGIAVVTPINSSLLFQATCNTSDVTITAQDLSAIPGGGLPFDFFNFQNGASRTFYVVVFGAQ